jgi:hypothetical protein
MVLCVLQVDLITRGLISVEDSFVQFFTLLVSNRSSTPNLRIIPSARGNIAGDLTVRGTSKKVRPAPAGVVQGIADACRTESMERAESSDGRWSFMVKDAPPVANMEMVETKMSPVDEDELDDGDEAKQKQ